MIVLSRCLDVVDGTIETQEFKKKQRREFESAFDDFMFDLQLKILAAVKDRKSIAIRVGVNPDTPDLKPLGWINIQFTN